MAESVAVTVNVVVPAVVGLPAIVAPLKLSPDGRLPVVTLQLMVPVPPVAAREEE